MACRAMAPRFAPLPTDLASAHALILAERAARLEAEADAAQARAANTSTEALIAHLKLEIEKLRRALYGSRSERKARLLEQMELQLEETRDRRHRRRVGGREGGGQDADGQVLPAQAPRAQAVSRASAARAGGDPGAGELPCCGSAKLSKLGEDVTETLEVIPRRWKVIQTVREKFSCRACETITQPPAPFHVTPRGFAGPNLLAMILFDKFGQHQPLNRQSDRFAREGIDLSVSTLADQVGACTSALRRCMRSSKPMCWRQSGCMAMTPRCRSWPRARPSPAASGRMSATTARSAAPHRRPRSIMPRGIAGRSIPSGILAASPASCRPTPIPAITGSMIRPGGRARSSPALCWAHARRKFFELADIAGHARRGKSGAGDLATRAGGGEAHRRAVRHRAHHQRRERR